MGRKVFKICLYGLRKHLVSYRTCLALVLSAILVFSSSEDLRGFCTAVGVGATPLPLFVYLTCTNYTQRVLLLCFLLMMCDAPFFDDSQPYVLLRSGRSTWSLGQMTYIVVTSILYWLWIITMSIVALMGHIVWELDWGRVYYSLTQTNGLMFLELFKPIQIWATATEAFIYSYGLSVLLSVFMTQCMYLLNMITSKNWGILVPVGFILLHAQYVTWFLPPEVLLYSPVSLANLNYITNGLDTSKPTVAYAFIFLTSAVIVMTILCVWAMRRRTIVLQKPM